MHAACTTSPPAGTPVKAKTCAPLSSTEIQAFQAAIVEQEVGATGCTLNNGGCQDLTGDPATPQPFTASQLSTPSGYTPISLGASGGATQDLYYNQIIFLLQNTTNTAVQKDCGSSLPAQDQRLPRQATLQAAEGRGKAVMSLFSTIPSLFNLPSKSSSIVEKSAYAALQTILQDAQGNPAKKVAPVGATTMDQLILTYIAQYGYTSTTNTHIPDLLGQNFTATELQTGLGPQEILNMAYFWLAKQSTAGENAFLPYFNPRAMVPGNSYYNGFSLFAGGGGYDNEALYDFVTQGMLHSATVSPGPGGQSVLTWTTHTGLATYLIQRDETAGNPPAPSACYVDMMQQNLVNNPKTYASQDCQSGQEATCPLSGSKKTTVPLWVLRAAEAQNAGSSQAYSTSCSAYQGSYPQSVGSHYNKTYQTLSPPTAQPAPKS
jgi:hypothetical protein